MSKANRITVWAVVKNPGTQEQTVIETFRCQATARDALAELQEWDSAPLDLMKIINGQLTTEF